MHDTSRSVDWPGLYEIASPQLGHFTSRQAESRGIGKALLSYHTKTGRLRRVQHGLYRFRDYPASYREEVMTAWLAAGKERAVVSHVSALDILELSDLIPDAVHLTLPRSARYLRPPWGVRYHTITHPFEPSDVIQREGVRLTSATRSILDVAEAAADPYQIHIAVWQAVRRGLTTPRRLRARSSRYPIWVRDLIERALESVEE
jgi:predicted transcriptional regulator of viral defense system